MCALRCLRQTRLEVPDCNCWPELSLGDLLQVDQKQVVGIYHYLAEAERSSHGLAPVLAPKKIHH